jgi:hypothetical protein
MVFQSGSFCLSDGIRLSELDDISVITKNRYKHRCARIKPEFMQQKSIEKTQPGKTYRGCHQIRPGKSQFSQIFPLQADNYQLLPLKKMRDKM